MISFEELKKILSLATEKYEEKNTVPTLLLAGRTGSGKSSLVNALAKDFVTEIGIIPTTQKPATVELSENKTPLRIVDLPGVGEANKFSQRLETMLANLPQAHVLIMAVPCPERSLSYEQELLCIIRKQFGRFPLPVILAGTKIDLAPPVKEWNPSSLNLDNPLTEKELNINKWKNYVCSILMQSNEIVFIPCSSGESGGWRDIEQQFGISKIRETIFDILPDSAKIYFARYDYLLKNKQAMSIITKYAGLAAVSAMQPVPAIPDAALILPIQIRMIAQLSLLYGEEMTIDRAMKLIGPLLTQQAGKFLFGQLSKLIPGLGPILGSTIAGGFTYSLGYAFHTLLHEGKVELNIDNFNKILNDVWDKYGKNYNYDNHKL